MLDYAEKRCFPRMEIDCPASFALEGESDYAGAIVKNLSGGGVLMWLEKAVDPGTVLSIEILPLSDITPPMKAMVRVLRCTPVDDTAGQFAVGCTMERVLE